MSLDATQRGRLVAGMAAALPLTSSLRAFVASVNQTAWADHAPQNAPHADIADAIVGAAMGGGWLRQLVGQLANKFPNVETFRELLPVIDAPGISDPPPPSVEALPDASAAVEPKAVQLNAGTFQNVNAGSIVSNATVNYTNNVNVISGDGLKRTLTFGGLVVVPALLVALVVFVTVRMANDYFELPPLQGHALRGTQILSLVVALPVGLVSAALLRRKRVIKNGGP